MFFVYSILQWEVSTLALAEADRQRNDVNVDCAAVGNAHGCSDEFEN